MAKPEGGYDEALTGYVPAEGQGAAAPLDRAGHGRHREPLAQPGGESGRRGQRSSRPRPQQGFAQLDTFAGQFFGGRDFGSGVLGSLGQPLAGRRRASRTPPSSTRSRT